MKQRVNLSGFSLLISFGSILILLWVLRQCQNLAGVISIALVLIGWVVLMFLFMPLYVSLDKNALTVHRPWRKRVIPLSDIKDIRLCSPTMGAKRLVGSGGFFGYWGWFRENDLGKYFAYYGKSSECFLVRLKDGRQYMLGCENPEKIVNAVRERQDVSLW